MKCIHKTKQGKRCRGKLMRLRRTCYVHRDIIGLDEQVDQFLNQFKPLVEQYQNRCCFCGHECSVNSQTCGICARALTASLFRL